jgi:enediyne biosynthesis protein E4
LGSGFLPLGFGTRMFDADNDGDPDLYVTNGHVIDNVAMYQPALTYTQKDLLYENVGGTFRDVSAESGDPLKAERVGRGLAVADFDNDGRLDVVIANLGRAPVLLHNDAGRQNNWLMIKASASKGNTSGLGARVSVETSRGVQVKEINNVSSYLSSSDIRLHFGLGNDTVVPRVELSWPGGTRQTLTDVAVNQVLSVDEPK